MLLADVYYLPIYVALGVVVGVLLLSVLASLLYPSPEVNVPTTDDFPRGV
jgi:hypothetical protein